jgi:acyl carrier protein
MWFKKTLEPAPVSAPVPVTEEVIEQQVKSFIDRKSKLIKSSELQRQTTLFTSGLLDSLTFVQLVVFLETTFQVKLPRAAVTTISSLDTMDQIIQVVFKAGSLK